MRDWRACSLLPVLGQISTQLQLYVRCIGRIHDVLPGHLVAQESAEVQRGMAGWQENPLASLGSGVVRSLFEPGRWEEGQGW